MRCSRPASATVLGAVLAMTAGCQLGTAGDHPAPGAGPATEPPPTSTATAPTTTAPATATATATATTTTAGTAVSAAAELTSSVFGRPGTLDLTVGQVHHGAPADGGLARDCHLTDDSTEYATVTVRFVDRGNLTKQGDLSNFRLDLSLPARSGAGILVSEEQIPTDYCGGGSELSPQITLQSQNLSDEHQDISVHLVARTSATHPDPLSGLTLTADHLRRRPDDINATPWTWHTTSVTAGAACPGDPDSLCVPLG